MPLVNISKKEIEYLLNCLNFHYLESDHKEHYMEINSQLCTKLDNIRQVCNCQEDKQ